MSQLAPPAAPLPGETCPGLSTWDASSPHRPGTDDFNGANLQNASGANGTAPPPNPGTHPTAALLNIWSLLAIALGGIIPNVRVSVTAGSPPAITYAMGAPSWVSLTAFIVTRNGAGDYSITYAQPTGTTTWAAATAYALNSFVLPPVANGFYYKATSVSGTGTSGATAPAFPTTVGSTVTDNAGGNQIVWTCWGPVNVLPPTASQPSASLNLAGGVVAAHYYAISSINIQNGVRVTTLFDGVLTDMNFSVDIY